MRRRAATVLAAAALAACAPLLFAPRSARGEVFLRAGGGASVESRLRDAGGTDVFGREAEVNGARGALRVWSVPAAGAAAAARALFGPDADPDASRFAALPDGRTWAAWIPGKDACGAMVFECEQMRKAAGAPAWPFADVAAPAGFEAGFSARMSGGGGPPSAVCSGRTGLAPEAAAGALRDALEAGGWVRATPGGERAGVCLFERPGGGAVVLACAFDSADGGTGWLVLRRGAE